MNQRTHETRMPSLRQVARTLGPRPRSMAHSEEKKKKKRDKRARGQGGDRPSKKRKVSPRERSRAIAAEVAAWASERLIVAQPQVAPAQLQSLPTDLLIRIAWLALVEVRYCHSGYKVAAMRADQELLGRLLRTSRAFDEAVNEIMRNRVLALAKELREMKPVGVDAAAWDERSVRRSLPGPTASLGTLLLKQHVDIQKIQRTTPWKNLNSVQIKVVMQDTQHEYGIYFVMSRTSKLEKLMRAFCDRTGTPMDSVEWRLANDDGKQALDKKLMEGMLNVRSDMPWMKGKFGRWLPLFGHETPDMLGMAVKPMWQTEISCSHPNVIEFLLSAHTPTRLRTAEETFRRELNARWLRYRHLACRREWANGLQARNPFGSDA